MLRQRRNVVVDEGACSITRIAYGDSTPYWTVFALRSGPLSLVRHEDPTAPDVPPAVDVRFRQFNALPRLPHWQEQQSLLQIVDSDHQDDLLLASPDPLIR